MKTQYIIKKIPKNAKTVADNQVTVYTDLNEAVATTKRLASREKHVFVLFKSVRAFGPKDDVVEIEIEEEEISD